MISIKNLTKTFNKFDGLKDVNLEIDKKNYGLIGYNGSGKTTLLKLMQGLTFLKKEPLQLMA